jgi:hypothetical protein
MLTLGQQRLHGIQKPWDVLTFEPDVHVNQSVYHK